jgi:hypothetical protein
VERERSRADLAEQEAEEARNKFREQMIVVQRIRRKAKETEAEKIKRKKVNLLRIIF